MPHATRTTPENITELKYREIFVFGSNIAGRHGRGAALIAKKRFGAVNGIGFGPQGWVYAIPTKGVNLEVLKLDTIRNYVEIFLRYAIANSDLTFLVTAIGCGLAHYKIFQIAPMFINAPENVVLPKSFMEVINTP